MPFRCGRNRATKGNVISRELSRQERKLSAGAGWLVTES